MKKKPDYNPAIEEGNKAHREKENLERFTRLAKNEDWKYYVELMKKEIRKNKNDSNKIFVIDQTSLVRDTMLKTQIIESERFIGYPKNAVEHAEKFFEEKKKGGK